MEVSSLLLLPQVAYSWHPPWCSGEGATITIRLRVTCKQLSVLATLVIVFEKLFYHFQFEYQILEWVKCLLENFSDRYFVDSCLQWWHPPWCSEEGAIITIHLRVTCKQLFVLATLIIVSFYHFQIENSELNACLHYFSDWQCLVDSILQWWYPPWCSDWHWYLFASSV